MGLYEPKGCCICFDLKNGSLIIASLNLIGSILLTLCAIPSIVFVESGLLRSMLIDLLKDPRNPPIDESKLKAYDPIDDIEKFSLGVCIFILVCSIIAGVCNSLLIHGIRKDRPALMLPQIILDRICITLNIIAIFLGVVMSAANGFTSCNQISIFSLATITSCNQISIFSLATIVYIYFHLVINAYHNQVKNALADSKEVYSFSHQKFENEKGSDMIKA